LNQEKEKASATELKGGGRGRQKQKCRKPYWMDSTTEGGITAPLELSSGVGESRVRYALRSPQ
jgi:hypothetical protein